MIRGLYSAATGMAAAQQNHEILAQNLANATVPGYRRRGVAFESFEQGLNELSNSQVSSDTLGTRPWKGFSGFEIGPVVYTGSPLDLAVDGDSFFVVQGPNGPLYTRNGTFKLSADGQLQTNDGLAVSGTNGPLTIPATARDIAVGQDGTVSADQVQVGQLQLSRFADPGQLVPAGTTLFEAPDGLQPLSQSGQVFQGYRENSNVQVVNEMVSMIVGMRHFEAAQRALRTLSESIQLNTRPQ